MGMRGNEIGGGEEGMGEMTSSPAFHARERFSREIEAATRRRNPGRTSKLVTDWCVERLHLHASSGKILDLACGNGRHIPDLRDGKSKVVAGDLSGPMLEVVIHDYPDTPLVRFEAERLPFGTGSFSGVFSARFLHHVPAGDPRRTILSEMFRVATQCVVLTYKATPSFEQAEVSLKYLLSRGSPSRYFYRWRELSEIAEACGWKIAETFAPPPAFFTANRGILFRPR
jgi:SAM-dependent methyltransferase